MQTPSPTYFIAKFHHSQILPFLLHSLKKKIHSIYETRKREGEWLLYFFFFFGFWVRSSVQSRGCVWLLATPWTAAHQASLSITNAQSLCKLIYIESVMPSNHLILCRPLLLSSSIFPSIRVFSNESVLCIRWPKYWSFSFSTVLPMNIQDWFPLGLSGLNSLQSKGLSRVFSNTTAQKHQFLSIQLSLWSSSHIHTRVLEKP